MPRRWRLPIWALWEWALAGSFAGCAASIPITRLRSARIWWGFASRGARGGVPCCNPCARRPAWRGHGAGTGTGPHAVSATAKAADRTRLENLALKERDEALRRIEGSTRRVATIPPTARAAKPGLNDLLRERERLILNNENTCQR